MKKGLVKASVFIMILTLLTQSLFPTITYGQSIETKDDKEFQLYQVLEELVIENNITLKTETYFYGKETENEEEIALQYADTYITIPRSNIQAVELEEEVPLFVETDKVESAELKPFLKDESLYALYPDETERILINEDVEYPVHQTKEGMEVVYVGNTVFYLNEEDRLVAKQAMDESTIEEPVKDEALLTKEEQIDVESDSEKTEEIPSDNLVEDSQSEEVSEENLKEEPQSEEVSEENPEEEPQSEEVSEENSVEDSQSEEVTEENLEEELQSEEVTEEKSEEAAQSQITTFSTFAAARQVIDPWEGSSADYFKTKVDNLVVFSKGNTKQLGTLTKGQVYPIESDYGNWHQIQYGTTSGYVYKADTLPNDGASLNNENKNYKHSSQSFVALQDATVYDNTSGSLVEFGNINKGERYPIVSEYGTNWSRVIFSDRVGYVLNSEVRHEFTGGERYFTVLTSNLPIYDNRSGSLKQVGSLTKGQVYEVVSDYGNWHRIQYNNHYGYVYKADTEPSQGSYIKNKNSSYSHSDRSFTALQDVIVYDNSSGKLKAFGTIDKGQSYYIASDYGNWWRVVFADRVGYVQKNKVNFNFFDTDKYFKVQVDNLAVYDNSGASLVKIGELKKGQVYPRFGPYGANWHRVNFGEGYGYVYTEGTELGNKSDINNLNTSYNNSNNKIVANSDIEVMDNSSGKLIPFGELTEGTIYPIASDYGDWWRILFLDRVGYVYKDSVYNHGVSETKYDLTLDEAVAIQSTASAQTDKEYDTYVSKDYIDNSNKVTATTLNVRGGPGTAYWTVGQLSKGATVTILGEVNGWYKIEFTKNSQWVNASPTDIRYYLDPLNFLHDERQQFQFLDLARSSDATASVLNKYLNGKGTLHGQGQAFIDASRIHGVNDVYLASHAMLETGNGNSRLAQGVKHNGVTVYNMFGVGAYDSCAISCGAAKAYEEGWTTPYKAIIGGARFIGNEYIKGENSEGRVLNTLYKMRWNPLAMAETGRYGKQYATDIGWASKQVSTMYNIYQQMDTYTLYLDIPIYKN